MATIQCRGCRRDISERAMACPHCGCFVVSEAAGPISAASDSAMRYVMPQSNLSGWAIAAGYLGLLSLALVFAPFAIFTGIMAIRNIKRDDKLRGLGRAWFGVVLGVLGTVGLVIVVIAAAKGK